MATVNEALLDERLGALEGKRNWSPRLISKLEQHIRSAPDRALFRINPLSFAAERGLKDDETVDLFLHATATGLFDMGWMLLCPLCSGVVQSFQHLNSVEKQYYCYPCQCGFDARLDEYIAIAFTVSREIRDIAYHHPQGLSPRDYYFEYCVSPEGRLPDGTPFASMLEKALLQVTHLPPGETTVVEVEVEPGFLMGTSHEGGIALFFSIEGERATEPQRLDLTFGERVRDFNSRTVAPGPLVLSIKNLRQERGTLLVTAFGPDFRKNRRC